MNDYSLAIFMTAKILSAQPLVEEIKKDLKHRCESLKNRGIQPAMSVVLVGDNPASLSYIRNKKKLCEEVGASFQLLQLLPAFLNKIFWLTWISSIMIPRYMGLLFNFQLVII